MSGSASSQFAGTFGGYGTVDLHGGTYNLAPGTQITAPGVSITGANVYFGTNLTYAGEFSMSDGGLYLGAFGSGPDTQLTLTGPATFTGGVIVGGGTDSVLNLKGTTTLSGYEQVSGNARVVNYGTATETGTLTLGAAGQGGAGLVNAKTGLFELVGSGSITSAGQPGTLVSNNGTIVKVGADTSVIKTNVVNNRTIQSFGGTLDFAGVVGGTGTLNVGGGGTMEFDHAAAFTQALSFVGGTGALLLNNAHDFHANIAGFGSGDTIDLSGFGMAEESLQYGFNSDGTGGTLSITSGTHAAALSFVGQYQAANFQAASDGHGGTLLTFAPTQTAGMITAHG